MTAHRNFKRRVRARAAKTGESYTAALRHFRPTLSGEDMPETTTNPLRIAVAQSTVRQDPTDVAGLRASAAEVRGFMKEAAEAGARLVHFPEGALCFPSKYVMSELGPDQVGPADWNKVEWSVLEEELERIAVLSGELGIWTLIPSIHRQPAARPFNSLYVVSDQGKVVARYDERTLSTTKITYMYTPGTEPVTIEVDGYRFGLALAMDAHIPEVLTEYDRLDVDGVLLSYSTAGVSGDRGAIAARGNAAAHMFWISFATTANAELPVHSGVLDPQGDWVAECPSDGRPAITLTDLHRDDAIPAAALAWRKETRARVSS
jgi:predicted amidohydrolase